MINVNDTVITEKEFQPACLEYQRQLKKDALNREERLAIANQLIDATLFLQDARQLGFAISGDELDKAYENIQSQYSSPEEFAGLLQNAGETDESFRAKLSNDLLLRKYLQQVFYSGVSIDEQQVEKLYSENKEKFMTGEQIRAAHILVPDEAKGNELHQQLNSGADFAALAKEHSQCPSSSKGGDLGFFGKGSMVPEFEAAAFDLAVGEVSGLVKTQFGYHLIKLEEKKSARAIEQAEACKMIRNELTQQEVRGKIQERVNKLRTDASIEMNEQMIEAGADK